MPGIGSEKPLVAHTKLASEGEIEFWIAESSGLDTNTFTIPIQRQVTEKFDRTTWQQAWLSLVKRHEGLRTFFVENKSGQLIRKLATVDVGSFEFTKTANAEEAKAYMHQRQSETVSMAAPPLWRAGVVETEQEKKSYFWLALHHSVGDGQSVNTILNDLSLLLRKDHLPSAPAPGSVLAAREKHYFSSADAELDAKYWDNRLQAIPWAAFAEWPLDKPRSPLNPPGNHRCEIRLNKGIAKTLKNLAKKHRASLHAVMLTLLALETRRRTGRSDFIIGTTASVRESAADAQIVGYGVNMLPVTCSFAHPKNFSEMLSQIQHQLAQALQHARYPFSRMCRTCWEKRPGLRNPLRYPLFDMAITENPGREKSLQSDFGDALCFKQLKQTDSEFGYEYTRVSPGQDMVFIHEIDEQGELILKLHVNAAIYTRETAQNRLESLAGWLYWFTGQPDRALEQIPRLLPGEEKRLAQLEYGEKVSRPSLQFHELIEKIIDQKGQSSRPAVVNGEEIITYALLDQKANALAHALKNQDVKQGDVVAVLTGRSACLPQTALGIWKAGAVYLPLAFDLPPERLSFIQRDAGVSHLVTLDGAEVPEILSRELPPVIRPEKFTGEFLNEHQKRLPIPEKQKGNTNDTAYILYTSGSTGQPKGTLISHSSYVNLVLGVIETYGLSKTDRCLMFASPSFDVSLSDIGVPLACGASVYPVSSATLESPNRFLQFLENNAITLADITPTYLRLFRGRKLPETLGILVTGGEAPFKEDVEIYAGPIDYYNAYGPTENTITSSMGVLKGTDEGLHSAGRPLPNTSLHICDDEGNSLPPGTIGEIWLGGAGLAKGYLNRPQQTQRAFVHTAKGLRYRSGDLGRWRNDGTVEIIGRIDEQVKLNGIRIELGELEFALTSHKSVAQSVALIAVGEGGKKSLWCFVRLYEGKKNPTYDEWREFMGTKLPTFMIPSGIQ
ncbi:MAG: amino acid adenylation domain-containing protein, partial [Spirochaetales bacterium]|nr:amino acid adenylation domain-containing protein [Spirochaetales bacterium]